MIALYEKLRDHQTDYTSSRGAHECVLMEIHPIVILVWTRMMDRLMLAWLKTETENTVTYNE